MKKGLYFYEFNGRLTFVTVTHVDDLFYAYDTRCKTTKSLLEAIVKELNMSRKQDDLFFVADALPRRFWHGESQLGHLVYWTSSAIKRVVRSTLAAEAYSVSEAVEEAQWLRSVLAEMWPSVPSSLPRSLRTVEMDFLRRPLRFLQSLPSCQVRQGYWTGQATPNRDGNAEASLLWSTGSDTCVSHDSHDARRFFDEGPGPFVSSLLAAMNARHHVFVTSDSSTGVKTTLPMPSVPVPTLKVAIGSQLIRSAASHSGRSGPCTD